jgi:hypothetical protein
MDLRYNKVLRLAHSIKSWQQVPATHDMVMVSLFVSDTHKVMTTLILLVLWYLQSVVCGVFSAFSQICWTDLKVVSHPGVPVLISPS